MSRYAELMQEIERGNASQSQRTARPVSTPAPEGSTRPQGQLLNLNLSLAAMARLRWRLILLCTMICVLLAGLVTLVLPKKYGAEVQFLVKNERQDLTITPQTSDPSQPSELNEAEVNSEMRMLLSHDLLDGVVRDNRLYAPYITDGSGIPDRRAIELAVNRLNKDLEVSAIRKTNIIQANYRAADPDLAAQVLKDLSRRYLNAHLAAHSTPGSYGFFLSELAGYRDALNKAELATGEFRRATQIYNPDQQRSALVAQLEDANARFENVDADMRERRARLAATTAEDNTASQRIPTDERTSVNQLTIDHLQTELADMENRRIGMLMKFKATDRAVQELDGEIANTRQNLASAKVEYAAEKTTTINPLHQSLAAMQSDNRIDISALEARRLALLNMRQGYLADLNKFDSNAVTLANLEQDQEIARQNFISYSKRFEEARLADQMDKEKFANVVTIETPFSSPLSVSRRLVPNLLAGAMLGLILGFSIAFLQPLKREAASRTGGFADQPLTP
jgi:uncharacterized protein involved in exopolysaccharide biosynthesis